MQYRVQIIYTIFMQNFIVQGGKKLSGEISVNTSKNAAVACLAAACLNKGKTTLRNVPAIEEVNRWLEVLESVGMTIERSGRHITLTPPKVFNFDTINKKSAMKTRSIILLIGSLSGRYDEFKIPQSGGCRLGLRTVQPHIDALASFGVDVKTRQYDYLVTVDRKHAVPERFALSESGDTVTENALFAAAQHGGVTEIRMTSANYMIQDVCFFLKKCGVKIDGIGTTTLRVHGVGKIDKDITYELSEDPIEAMFFIALAIVAKGEFVIKRCPYDFIELELTKLRLMGLSFTCSDFYKARNGHTVLTDITIHRSRLRALPDKIEARPFPGLNMDNLPFFSVIATQVRGTTLLHDWAYENRSVYFTELNRLGAQVKLLDQHRAEITGITKMTPARMTCPPALRPGAVLLVAMLAAPGKSVLRDVYMINRGYENLAERLQALGADIEMQTVKA